MILHLKVGASRLVQLQRSLEILDLQAVEANPYSLASLLQDCGNRHALREGKKVHGIIWKTGFKQDIFLANHLIMMYGKCGSVIDARHVFNEMPARNLISWNVMIGAYAKNGYYEEAFHVFQKLQQEDFMPDIISFVGILTACNKPESLLLGKLLHAHVIFHGVESHAAVGNALLNMYRKCGSIKNARQMFDRMPERDVAVWNAIVGAYAENGLSQEALKLFQQMIQEGINPDKITFITILKVCNSPENLEVGKQLHALVASDGYESNVAVGNALLNMYWKCRHIDAAQKMFDRMPERDLISWNTIIGGYASLGYGEKAFRLIRKMQRHDVMPDKVTFVSILNIFSGPGDLALGKLIHGLSIDVELESEVIVGNALVNMYGKCGNTYDACRIFEKMAVHDVVSWTAIITAFSENNRLDEALNLFREMLHAGVKPDRVTFVGILNACADHQSLGCGRLVHNYVIHSGFESDLFVAPALVGMYGRCASIEDARKVFNGMPQRNVVSWNVMISAYSHLGYDKEAFRLFLQMQQEGMNLDKVTLTSIFNGSANLEAPGVAKLVHSIVLNEVDADVVVGNILIGIYGKCGNLEDACRVFNHMPEKDVISWNTIISLYCKHGRTEQAFETFHKMQKESVRPDKVTFISILNVCDSPEALELGRWIHKHIIESGIDADVVVGNALINMYSKCGSVQDAVNTFERMHERNVVTWTALIAAYAQHGHAKEALRSFWQMRTEGVKPDKITFVSVLNACSHAGLVDEGLSHFESMSKDYGIRPIMEHYNCIVDLLGRAGQLKKAEQFINSMPFQPDPVIWVTLLGACRVHKCIDQGQRAAEYAVQLDPQSSSAYVVLSNIYSAAGKWDDAANMRKLMGERAVKKEAGCSWIEIDGSVHEFVVRDKSHPQAKEIYIELEKLNKVMEDAGYVPDTDLVLHDVEEEQKVSLLSHHSEKLAIAYGIMSTSCGTPLRITKNLRVCPDCHTAIKFLSKLAKREIVVRDNLRFHHFKDGACSCGDYW